MNPLSLIPEWVKLAAMAVLLAAVGVQTLRLANEEADHAKTREVYATDGKKAADRALVLQQERDAAREALATKLSSIDASENAKLKEAENENTRLRYCLRRGTCGLRIAAVCPDASGNLPKAAPGGGLDTGAGAGLTAQAQQDYLDLRAGINSAQRKLAACQKSLSSLTGQSS